jgi:hypothetical protein
MRRRQFTRFRIPKRSYRKASLTLDDVGYSDPLPDDGTHSGRWVPKASSRVKFSIEGRIAGAPWLPWKVPEPLWLPPEVPYDEGSREPHPFSCSGGVLVFASAMCPSSPGAPRTSPRSAISSPRQPIEGLQAVEPKTTQEASPRRS